VRERPAIIAALPREIAGLVRGWERRELPGKVFVYTNGGAVAACAGMGSSRVSLAVEAAMAAGPVTTLISAGVAGACDPALKPGDIVRAGEVIDSRTGERFSDTQFKQVLVTTPVIANVSEKRRLHASYGASAVDMEAATVARMARGHGLTFQAIKAISDGTDFELEGLSKFATDNGQFREAAFALHAAVRPAMWGKVSQLARNSNRAIESLTTVLDEEVRWYRGRV
jgi:adenosylhomocysteine nucleosidase